MRRAGSRSYEAIVSLVRKPAQYQRVMMMFRSTCSFDLINETGRLLHFTICCCEFDGWTPPPPPRVLELRHRSGVANHLHQATVSRRQLHRFYQWPPSNNHGKGYLCESPNDCWSTDCFHGDMFLSHMSADKSVKTGLVTVWLFIDLIDAQSHSSILELFCPVDHVEREGQGRCVSCAIMAQALHELVVGATLHFQAHHNGCLASIDSSWKWRVILGWRVWDNPEGRRFALGIDVKVQCNLYNVHHWIRNTIN